MPVWTNTVVTKFDLIRYFFLVQGAKEKKPINNAQSNGKVTVAPIQIPKQSEPPKMSFRDSLIRSPTKTASLVLSLYFFFCQCFVSSIFFFLSYFQRRRLENCNESCSKSSSSAKQRYPRKKVLFNFQRGWKVTESRCYPIGAVNCSHHVG